MSYWDGPAGARHRRRFRRATVLRVHVAQEPVQKGRRGRATGSEFRADVHAATDGRAGWPKPRAHLAVDLLFTTSKKQPPSLERLAKHYIDQLAATHDEGEAGHLYRDDRQIKLLHVSAQHRWDGGDLVLLPPGIWVVARTASDAIADMAAAAGLPEGDTDELDDLAWEEVDEQMRDAERLSGSGNPHLRRAAPLIRFHAQRAAQESFLRTNDRLLRSVLCQAAPSVIGKAPEAPAAVMGLLGPERIAEVQAAPLRWLIDGRIPGTVLLPHLPTFRGDGERFRTGVRDAIDAYVEGHPLLFPLLVPVRLTVFVVQPEQPRDLDNILLDVLPVVDEVMKPPQEPWLLSAVDQAEDDTDEGSLGEWRRRGLRRLRSVIEHGVWSCQVVEVARTPADPLEGRLAMVLGHGECMESTWAEAESRLEVADESAEELW